MSANDKIYNQIKAEWDKIAKPLDGFGRFESIIAKIGAAQNSICPKLEKSALLVLCADNGIVEEGVSQSGKEVTAICAKNIAAKKSTVGILSNQVGCEVLTVDLGIDCCGGIPNVMDKKIRRGTRNFLKEPAMTKAELERAIEIGEELVGFCAEQGYQILCIGEMGIGNTTTSAAVAAALLGEEAATVTGRGAGLSDEGLRRKTAAIDEAIKKYDLYNKPPIEVLRCVGGFDIAGMVGVYFGAKKHRMPVILDGAISLAAALVAIKIDSTCVDFLIPSHKSRESLAKKICSELARESDFSPILDADMATGEGTGAIMLLGLLKNVLAVYENALRFGLCDDGGKNNSAGGSDLIGLSGVSNVSGVAQYKRF